MSWRARRSTRCSCSRRACLFLFIGSLSLFDERLSQPTPSFLPNQIHTNPPHTHTHPPAPPARR